MTLFMLNYGKFLFFYESKGRWTDKEYFYRNLKILMEFVILVRMRGILIQLPTRSVQYTFTKRLVADGGCRDEDLHQTCQSYILTVPTV